MSTNIRQRDDIVTFSPSLGSSPDGQELGSLHRRWLQGFTDTITVLSTSTTIYSQCLIWTKINAWWRTAVSWTHLITVIVHDVVDLQSEISTADEVGDHTGLIVYVPGTASMQLVNFYTTAS